MKPIYIILFTTLFIFACKKDDDNLSPKPVTDPDTISITFPEYLNNYFWFDEGSYWIYEDPRFGDLDTIWVTGDTSFITVEQISSDLYVEYLYRAVRMHNYRRNESFVYRLQSPFDIDTTSGKFTSMLSQAPALDWGIDRQGPITYSENHNDSMFYSDGWSFVSYLRTEKSITLNSGTFNNVTVFRVGTNIKYFFSSGRYVDYYMAENVGLIKTEVVFDGGSATSSPLNLIEYFVIKK